MAQSERNIAASSSQESVSISENNSSCEKKEMAANSVFEKNDTPNQNLETSNTIDFVNPSDVNNDKQSSLLRRNPSRKRQRSPQRQHSSPRTEVQSQRMTRRRRQQNEQDKEQVSPEAQRLDVSDTTADDDDDAELSEEESPKPRKVRKGRRKIAIEFIEDKSRRHITFSKRKTGIMKKAYELATLTGTQVLLLVASETGHVYTFATNKLQPLITQPEGKSLIQACLNAPDVPSTPPTYPCRDNSNNRTDYENNNKLSNNYKPNNSSYNSNINSNDGNNNNSSNDNKAQSKETHIDEEFESQSLTPSASQPLVSLASSPFVENKKGLSTIQEPQLNSTPDFNSYLPQQSQFPLFAQQHLFGISQPYPPNYMSSMNAMSTIPPRPSTNNIYPGPTSHSLPQQPNFGGVALGKQVPPPPFPVNSTSMGIPFLCQQPISLQGQGGAASNHELNGSVSYLDK
jgi:hypothetical protein